MFIEQPSTFLRWLYPKAVWRMNSHEKAVYLTFDDGPLPETTPFILDTLREFGVRATFFMVGENVLRHHDLYNRIVEEGHQVGNHTFNHLGSFKHMSITYALNVIKANELIHAHLFRPPHGLLVGKPQVSHHHVGCRHPRLFQVDNSRGRAQQRKAIYPQRVYHYLSRFAQEHRQVALCLARSSEMVKRTRI